MPETAAISETTLSALKRLQQRRPARERCELCSVPLADAHSHLLEVKARRIACSCDACALLFEEPGRRFRRVPRDAYFLSGFTLDDLRWESLGVPINLAFVLFSSEAGRAVAYYPSPGGATESSLNLDGWNDIASSHTRVGGMQPDVEALLANRLANPQEYYVAPIDRCYELAGIVRKHWTGFTGGDEVWREIGRFFEELRERAIKA